MKIPFKLDALSGINERVHRLPPSTTSQYLSGVYSSLCLCQELSLSLSSFSLFLHFPASKSSLTTREAG
ncbi:hypothetical protein Nepgr_029823 [Nepenthes gracilis]|uniref:Uncharacterized protein n=1 Tax=Nepenthes gracilis TaxID=150966 RepID=A0AAD3TDB3_NEPGR|nr:hypothetical protein Nepgr_029823 [Nepenthes gracilis]